MTVTAAHPRTAARPTATTLPRLLAGTAAGRLGLAEHLARHGELPMTDRLADVVAAAGLLGRGGAAFPTAVKLREVADAVASGGGAAVVVANAAEGEPGSHKDAALVALAPHLVLDGIALVAAAVGADSAKIALRADDRVRASLSEALRERAAARLPDPVPVPVPVQEVVAPRRFLVGEESAVVRLVEGAIPIPSFRLTRVSHSGVDRRPTLVTNVETLAQLALIARWGPEWFRAVGTAAEPGSMLTTLHTATAGPRIRELAIGTRLTDVVELDATAAVLVGGFHGGWVTTADAQTGLRLSEADLAPRGLARGAGVLATLPAGRCGLAESARVLTYLAQQSAGQCGPCRNGLPRIAVTATALAARDATAGDVDALHRWAGLVEGRGACHHPDGSARFLRSSLVTFAEEVAVHRRGRCTGTDQQPALPVPETPMTGTRTRP